MGRITSLFARKVIRAAGEAVDEAEFLSSVGLPPDREADVAEMLTADAYYALLERIAAAMDAAAPAGGTELPLLAGASMRCDDYGAFGLAWKAAPTLRASIARAERYALLLTSVSEYELCPCAQGAYLHLHRTGERRLGLRLSNEATLASIVSIIREVSTQPFSPREVYLKHPAPAASLAAHRSYFGAPVRFGSDMDALLISTEALARPNRLGDEGITRFLLGHLDAELAKLEAEPALAQTVRNAIVRALSDGAPKMAAIARRLGMSERTLHRRLAEEGLAFQTLVSETRRELAEGLLARSDYSLAEVAFLTGFSEQSAFTRAFRRWSDQTPAAFRDSRRAAAG